MSSQGKQVVVLATGTVVAISTVVFVQYIRRVIRRKCREKLEQHIDDSISLEDLGVLALHAPQVNLRRSAEQMILDKAIKSPYFDDILKYCVNNDDEALTLKAATVLCVILKNVNFRELSDERKILSVLGMCFTRIVHQGGFKKQCKDVFLKQRVKARLAGVMFDVICDVDERKMMLIWETEGLLETILHEMQTTDSKEVMRYCLFIVHQLCLCDGLVTELLDQGFVGIVSAMIGNYWGDVVIQRICLQMLVLIVNTQSVDEKKTLAEISSYNVIMHAVVCLKSEESVLVYWAVALLHEFAVNEMFRKDICKLPYLLKNLQKALCGGHSGLQRLVLRVICFLALRNDPFKSEVLKYNQILIRIPICLSSGDKDVVHWALVLTHDLAMLGKSAVEKLLTSCEGILQSMTALANSQDGVLVRLLAETLGFFCCCEQLHHQLVKGGILAPVLYFAECQDPELTFWASALMLNLAMTSEEVKIEILKAGGLQTLVDLCIGQFENTQVVTMAAKTLSMLGYVDSSLEFTVEIDSESSSISVHDKPYHCNAPGINVMIWDTLANEEAIYQNLSLEQYPAIGELHLDIPCLCANEGRNIGNIVFITIRGKHGDRYLKGLKKILILDETTSFSGVTTFNELDLPDNHTCVVVATLFDENRLLVKLIDKSIKHSKVNLSFPYADLVNQRVTNLVLVPTIDLLVNSPPSRNISRVSEMELLEVLARNPIHKDVMFVRVNGFMDHLTNLIMFCSNKGVSSFQSQPLPLAHCLGALRVLASSTTHDSWSLTAGFLSQLSQQLESCKKRELENKTLVGAAVSLLFNITNLWIHAVLDNVTLEYHNGDRLSPSKNRNDTSGNSNLLDDQSEARSTGVGQSEVRDRHVGQSGSRLSSESGSADADDPLLRTTVIAHERSDKTLVKATTEISEDRQRRHLSSEVDEYDEMYASLARFSVLLLGNLATINEKDTCKLCREVLSQSGAVHLLWCTLLCSGGPLKFNITVPVVSALTRLSCTEWKPLPMYGVVLNADDKTAALLLTGDCLEVRNDNWTFESVRTNLPICASEMDDLPVGWYYEVTLKSSSIMQIGWASKDCHFSPEKGLGVGDNIHSYAFDAARCKVWNGPITEQMNNDYGTEWRDGDVVSCLLHSDGTLSFWLNGVDLGTAFLDIDMTEAWYPACSLSTDQQVRFNFGATPFRFKIPEGFVPVNTISSAGSYMDKRNIGDVNQDFSAKSATTKPSTAWWIPLDNASKSHDQDQPIIRSPDSVDPYQQISTDSALDDIVNSNHYQPISIDVTSDAFDDSNHYSPISCGVTYDGAGDSQYPPISGDVGIGDEELCRLDGGGDQPCQPINLDLMNDNIDSQLHQPISPDLMCEEEDVPVSQPIIRELADVGGGQGESHPPPSLYFEITLTCNDERPLSFGFRNVDDSQSVQCVVCPNNTMLMPDGDKVKFSSHSQLVLGCGLLLPPGACFFTINGQPIKFLYTFYDEEVGQGPLLPYSSDPFLNVNFGDTYFMYDAGNEREIRLGMAALLHDYHESRLMASATFQPRQEGTR